MNTVRPDGVEGLKGRHVLMAFLGFFLVVFAVNGVFLYSAISTYTGIVAVEPYRKGLNYNQRIAADEAQKAQGWHDALEVTRSGQVTLRLTNRLGVPVEGLAVTGTFGRPSTAQHDVKLELTELQPGTYSAQMAPPEAGAWMVALEARPLAAPAEIAYQLRKRLWLKP
ncbi:MAG TPA: FixH family protein [Hyphomicrobiaceae bacterium]|nr:FixH family protein [Hyphomicrobiaceae bacterium]